MICAYFHKQELPLLTSVRLIPVDQILFIAENIDSLPILKLNEVLLRVLFKDLQPTPLFNIREEIQKVSTLTKVISFKKIHIKKFIFGIVHTTKKVKRFRKCLERLKKEDAIKAQKNEVNSLKNEQDSVKHSDAFSAVSEQSIYRRANLPATMRYIKESSHIFVILQDKVFMLVLREIYNMHTNVEIYRNLVNAVPEHSLELMARSFMETRKGSPSVIFGQLGGEFNMSGGDQTGSVAGFLKLLGSSNSLGDDNQSSKSEDLDFSFGMEAMSEKSSSLFNFEL